MSTLKKYPRVFLACAIAGLVLYLFYRSFYVEILLIPFFFFIRRFAEKEAKRRYKENLNVQFKDALVALAAALRAGYSIENAIQESYAETKMMYGEDAPICQELKKMLVQINLGVSAVALFFDLGKRSEVEDIETFASVFSIAKRSGGDQVEIIRKTASDIAAKIDTRQEITVLITSKRFEQNIMNVVPLGIIVYISLTSGGLLDQLYGNVLGILVMTVCLGLYGFAFVLSRKIMDIRV